MTMNALTNWYLKPKKIKAPSSYWFIELSIGKFNKVFGDWIVTYIKLADLENYQDKEPRTTHICDNIYEILSKVPRAIHDSHVFLRRGMPFREFRSVLTKACENAGVKYGRFEKDGFVFHDS